MNRLVVFLALFFTAVCGAYEVPQGVVNISELEKAQAKAKVSEKPVVFVLAFKTQPET